MPPASRRELAFYETMPDRYRQLFRGPTVDEHAAIAARRGGAPAHAEIWRRLPNGRAIACLVAEDRQGLHSNIGTAFTTQSIDILSAQLYSRAAPRGAEVFDLFWLCREEGTAAAIAPTDLARVADLLGGLMTGDLRMGGRPLAARHASSQASATLVRLEEASEGGPATLSLETIERPGLFHAVTSALLDAKVRIISSKQSSVQAARVIHRLSLAEQDGRAPDQYRRGFLQAEVLRVLERVTRRSSTAPSDSPPSSLEEAAESMRMRSPRRDRVFLRDALPLPSTCECDDACEPVAPVLRPSSGSIEAPSHQAQVLVVEDGRADRELLVAELGSAGFAVLEASDGDTAIELATHSRPQVIVLDLILPGPSGFQITRMLRADERTKQIAIVALTRLTSNSFRRLAHDAGCDAYLQKPVDGSTVVSEVSRLLENLVHGPSRAPMRGVLER